MEETCLYRRPSFSCHDGAVGGSLNGAETNEMFRGGWSQELKQHVYHKRDHILDYNLEEDDTLFSIASKYKIHVAELKRVNNILNDAEFFALRKIKIPVPRASLLTEVLPGDPPPEQGGFTNSNGWVVESKDVIDKSLIGDISIASSSSSSSVSFNQEAVFGTDGDNENHGIDNASKVKGGKAKRKVDKMFNGIDFELQLIKSKQSEMEDWIKSSEAFEGSEDMPRQNDRNVSKDPYFSGLGLAFLWTFLFVIGIVMLAGVLIVVRHHKGLY